MSVVSAHGQLFARRPKSPGWNCEVCRAIERWKSQGRPLVLMREIMQQRGLYILDADRLPASDEAGYLLQMRFREMSSAEIRRCFQAILASAEQVWVAKSDRSVRVR